MSSIVEGAGSLGTEYDKLALDVTRMEQELETTVAKITEHRQKMLAILQSKASKLGYGLHVCSEPRGQSTRDPQ